MKNIIAFEIIGVIISILVALLVLLPFYIFNIDFLFYIENCIIIVVGINFMRWQFFIDKSFFYRSLILHGVLFVLSIFAIIVVYGIYGDFKFFFEEANLNTLFGHLSFKDSVVIRNYMKVEFTFFAIFTIVSSFLFNIKLIKSVWRIKNTK